jgi:hypothetical protein
MTTPTLIYDTNPMTGLHYLRPHEGPAGTWTEVELRDLERVLKSQLERLRRETSSTVQVGSRTYQVENANPNGSRQPTLIVRPLPAAGTGKPRSEPAPATASWSDGLFAEAGKLAARPLLPRLEGRALQAAVEELQAFAQENPSCLIPLLLGSYLARAEQLYLPEDVQRAGIYGMALRGLERLMPEAEADGAPGWKLNPPGRIESSTGPAESWINRLVAWALGRNVSGAVRGQEP